MVNRSSSLLALLQPFATVMDKCSSTKMQKVTDKSKKLAYYCTIIFLGAIAGAE